MDNLFHEGFTQNRELSWLRFNERILEEACDTSVPLLERLRFVQIFDNNLNEFFMVRVGSLIEDYEDGDENIDELSGMTAGEQLDEISLLAESLLGKRDHVCSELRHALEEVGIRELEYNELNAAGRAVADEYWNNNIRDRLAVRLIGKDNLAQGIRSSSFIIGSVITETDSRFYIMDIPVGLPGLVFIDDSWYGDSSISFITTENLIKARIGEVTIPFAPGECVHATITRTSEVDIDESGDLMRDMKKIVRKRARADVDRIVLDREPSSELRSYIEEELELSSRQVFIASDNYYEHIDELADKINPVLLSGLQNEDFTPFDIMSLRKDSVIDTVKKEDLLLSYPYDSMKPFLRMLEEASEDPRVIEIRMTIYRLSSNPVIAEHLINAARNGKRVRLLIELRARFDEDRNIEWAERFREAGCEVNYGLEDYKVHSKLCQLVLRDGTGKSYITQIGTGNYNEKTARQYTDLSLITSDERIGRDADRLFRNILIGRNDEYDYLLAAPKGLYKQLIKNIRREAEKGEAGRIFIKCNAINEPVLMEELMLASQAGCRITLLVRGICCILPGIEDCTTNVSVMNIVGRFLEHSRVYIFGEGEDELMYLSSADLMKRNMHRRVEVACPVFSQELRQRIRAIMFLNVRDNVKGRKMLSDGSYARKQCTGENIDSQALLLKYSAVN